VLALGPLLLGLAAGLPGVAFAAPFEAPVRSASELLSPELLKGPHHSVEERVGSDGFQPVFTVNSEFGSAEVTGEDALRERVREIGALVALREARSAPATTPSPAIPPTGQLPALQGAWGTGAQGSLVLPGKGEEGGFVDLQAMQRAVAHRLGIDPYTQNAELQEELRRHVWATYAGGQSSPFVPESSEAEATPPDEAERADELLRHFSEEDLRRLHRIELAVMGVDEELREQFLENEHYTSQHGARMLDSLADLEETSDRAAFISAAAGASSVDEARSFGRIAELMRRYGSQTGGLERFAIVQGRVAAYATDGTLVVPVLADHGVWTQGVASFAQSMARAAGQDPDVTRTELLMSGSLSSRAKQELRNLGLSVREQGLAPEEATPATD